MFFILIIIGVTLTEIRIDAFGDTTAKFVSLYPEYPGNTILEGKIIKLINKKRIEQNLPELSIGPHLRIAAREHSLEMIEKSYFSHISPLAINRTPAIRIYNSGLLQYKIGENIAQNVGSLMPILLKEDPDSLARIIVRCWMESPHHRENILDPDYTHMGVGAVARDTILNVTETFADISSGVDSVIVENKGSNYLMNIYLSHSTWSMTVFKDECIIPEDSLEYYSKRIRVPIKINSGAHKIELCSKDSGMYLCKVRIFIQTNAARGELFQPLTEFN
ncbi:hypothetical protein KAX29_00935 [candidate division WOR-3 bacterium]|nr:hypothetical protein [candidate division WOR-3 bacterium]